MAGSGEENAVEMPVNIGFCGSSESEMREEVVSAFSTNLSAYGLARKSFSVNEENRSLRCRVF